MPVCVAAQLDALSLCALLHQLIALSRCCELCLSLNVLRASWFASPSWLPGIAGVLLDPHAHHAKAVMPVNSRHINNWHRQQQLGQ